MHHFIVIGNPIAHSKSPAIHAAFARQVGLEICYQRQFCPNDFDSFCAVVRAFFCGGGVGANVTLPFKEMAWRLCDETGELSEYARTAGAVNTLSQKNGKLYGDNTDGRGLVADLMGQGVLLQGKRVAILGAGGATRGAMLPLLQAGASLAVFNRTPARAETLVADFKKFTKNQLLTSHSLDELTGDFDVIINATSAGTTNQPLHLFQKSITAAYAYDMAYGKETEFLRYFAGQGAVCFDGMGMLIAQAKLAFEGWTGQRVDLGQVVFGEL